MNPLISLTPYIFDGPPCNLGAFGTVKRGDVLMLSPMEAKAITTSKDPRFTKVEGPKIPACRGDYIRVTRAMTGDERAAARRHNMRELARLTQLQEANQGERKIMQMLRECTHSQLIAIVEDIQRRGGAADFNGTTSRDELIRQCVLNRKVLIAGLENRPVPQPPKEALEEDPKRAYLEPAEA